MTQEYPYWGECVVEKVANGWQVREKVGRDDLVCIAHVWVFGDLQWDACQDFIRAVTSERKPTGHSGTGQKNISG
jgi:hypothetical protein